MKKKQERDEDAGAVGKAVGSLLRLANGDLKDAGLLSAGRSPGNAPALVQLAFDRLTLAVIATERGWPLPSAAVDRTLIPGANPLKAKLTGAARSLPGLQSFPAVGRAGYADAAPDREIIHAAIRAMSALLKELAGQFEVDLLGDNPAGRPSPIRRKPLPSPPPPAKLARPARHNAAPDLPPTVPRPPLPPHHRTEPRDVEGRAPLAPAPSSSNTASTSFWTLMDAWRVEDSNALALIGHPGGLTKKGTRPRFKLTGDEVAMFRGLQEIASALTSLQREPQAWLNQPVQGAPFAGATPIGYLTEQRLPGVRNTIRFILQQGLKLSVSAGTR